MNQKTFTVTRPVRLAVIAAFIGAAALAGACGKPAAPVPPRPAPTTPAASPGAAAAAMISTHTGVYTGAQATEGKTTFDSRCITCHTAVSVTSSDFRKAWHGKALWRYFDTVRRTMPQDDPGSLSDQQYAAVIAYLLQTASMPAGSVALPSDSASLSKIRIDTVAVRAQTGTR